MGLFQIRICCLLMLCAVFTSAGQTPGGVADGLRFWIRADAGTDCNTPDCRVSQWDDQSGYGDHVAQSSNTRKPRFETASVNFNPGVYFDGSNDRMRAELSDYTSNFTFFIVGLLDTSTTPQGTFFNNHYSNGSGNGEASSFQLDSDGNTYRYRNDDEVLFGPYVPDFVILAVTNTDNGSSPTTTVTAYRNELPVETVELSGNHRGQTFEDYTLGVNRINNSHLLGYISEIVLYDRVLDSDEINRVESYLAIKYGITLGTNGTSLDYHSSLGTKMWNTGANAGYNYDIAGVGRDDQAGQYQRQSLSIYHRDFVTVGIGPTLHPSNLLNPNTFDNNDSYFIWGHNGADLGCSGFDAGMTENGEFILERMNRDWKAQETGTVGTTTIEFDMTESTLGDLATSSYRLLVDEDGNFREEALSIEPVLVDPAGQRLQFRYDFTGASGYHFTLGLTGTPAELSADTSICPGDTAVLRISLPLGGGPVDLLINDGQQDIPLPGVNGDVSFPAAPTESTVYYLVYENGDLCNGRLVLDSMFMEVLPLPEPGLPADTAVCSWPFPLDVTGSGDSYAWQDGSGAPTFTASEAGIYWVTVTQSGCSATDSIAVDDAGTGPALISASICSGDSATIDGIRFYTSTGTYTDTLAGRLCDSIVVLMLDVRPIVAFSAIRTICEGDSITINGSDYYSVTGIHTDTLAGTSCDSAVSIDLTVVPLQVYPVEITLCPGDSATIDGMEFFSGPGTYSDTISGYLCDSIVELTLTTTPVIVSSLEDSLICDGSEVVFCAPAGASDVTWSTGSEDPCSGFTDPGLYWLEIDDGCKPVRDTFQISLVNCECHWLIPTAFTPNGDAVNDYFFLRSDCELLETELRIFNRWGELIFQTDDPEPGWDGRYRGKEAPIGAYVWILTGREVLREEIGKTFVRKGSVLLIR